MFWSISDPTMDRICQLCCVQHCTIFRSSLSCWIMSYPLFFCCQYKPQQHFIDISTRKSHYTFNTYCDRCYWFLYGVCSYSQSRVGITCKNNTKPGLIFTAVNHVHLSNLKFFECYRDICYNSPDHKDIKLITLAASSLVLVKCIFEDNVGTGLINATHSNITIVQSTFKDNVRIKHEIFEFIYCNTTIVNSAFINNDGPTLLSVRKFGEVGSITTVPRLTTTMNITSCEFRNNHRRNNHRSNLNDDHFLTRTFDVNNSDILLIYDAKFISNKVDKILHAKESAINTDNYTIMVQSCTSTRAKWIYLTQFSTIMFMKQLH